MCDTAVRVLPGRVLFAKNSDRDPNEAQLLEWHPAREHHAGAALRCTWIGIPQARRTHALLVSRPFWMWGAEIGANEHGVTIGNEAVFTRRPYAKSGLTGMDLLRLALERAASADEAVHVITRLLEEHGQGGGCGHEHRGFTYHNSYIVADGRSAYVLETAARDWECERVEGGRSISNGLTIPTFARAHSDRVRTFASGASVRRACTEARAARMQTPADAMALLRDHGQGRAAPRYNRLNGGMRAPCMHAGGGYVNSQTTASWVAELTPDAARHWATGTAAPCTGLFKPVRVDEPLDLGPAPSDAADDQSLWWRHERLHRAALRDPGHWLPAIAASQADLEARWLADDTEPDKAFAEGDRWLAEWTARLETAPDSDRRSTAIRRYWAQRDVGAG